MTTPKSSPTLKATRSVGTTDQRRVVSDSNALQPLSPSLQPPSSPYLPPLPDTSDDLSTESRLPLLASSVASSTPYSVKYIRPLPGNLFETPTNTESSGDRSFSTPSVNNSGSSASMDIFLGPQPISYVHHRQRLLDDDFDRSPSRPSPAMLAAKASHAVAVKADVNDGLNSEKGGADEVVHLSTWRQKQLKKFKHGRPVAGARERPIPTLHGPLSLPYARNPSGVDATVADQSSYMTHVFGIRAANSTVTLTTTSKSDSTSRTSRIPSDSTNRTTSGSSYLSTEGLSDYPPSSSSSLSSVKPPIMVRDPTQVTGQKKGSSMDSSKLNLNPELLLPPTNSNQHRSQVDIRSQLGIGKPLAPIPGSPPPVPFFGIDSAIHSASMATWQGPADQNHNLSDFVSLALVDPVTNSVFNVRVPKSPNATALGSIPCEIVPTGSKFNALHQSATSKADASANWRNRTSSVPMVQVSGSPGQGSLHHFSGSLSSPTKSPVEVITIDQLSQKFGHMRTDSNGKTEKPTNAIINKKGDKPISKMEPSAKTLGDSIGRQVNVDPLVAKVSSTKKLRIAVNKKSSSPTTSRLKGTPNAGKHLKPAATEAAVSVK
ncbi:uncharacterized protein CcaverHIS019_0201950 [Cutaneotrichosporon cavernicola]|uniref:Uncharacterized protein n=1 Tax=Cutaneotrichosporon cavernicola TaxID=279322 RepID=A0AA48IIB9_9TREE|nr:uncharacterized protein CcaverHIS019_0201950 [Cutaneotrichosporon cavernicola]BEI88833.1 hypothetical protein CcaverHIS019_0201950 [Cutaneotrichosporon cavernicola]BEI96608.1 hypothetical protein CcaverHIS631_0201970 [Cutaneotrichosporon cavernicola]BEJ04380.1 hypothetical protein CcaverHIS641_0201970 [Cutaneotrichosporon cavernicola]